MTKTEKIFERLNYYKQVLEEKGYDVIYIGLHGSQNYNLDDKQSDYDVKAIVSLNLHDIINRKVISTTIETETGHIDTKDLLTFYEVVRKGNFAYVESIDTDYWIGDEYIKNLLKKCRPNLKSMLGAMHEKRKALTHEYPSKHEEFRKWGFDPKQYHHIYRLLLLLEHNINYDDDESYLCYDVEDITRLQLIFAKRNTFDMDLSKVEEQSDYWIEEAKELLPKDYTYEPIDLSNEINYYIENKIKEQLRSE